MPTYLTYWLREFGVLRALGINRSQLTRVFIYESLAVIGSAIILGTSIGVALATLLTLQQNIFTELPFKLVLPGWLFMSMIFLSVVVAALGAYIPVSSILPWSIARVLKQT
jgi:ABC-type antimicrobial peptide transport system permease subunit